MYILRRTHFKECCTFLKSFRCIAITSKVSDNKEINFDFLSKLFNKSTEDIGQFLDKNPKLCSYDISQLQDVVNICKKYSINENELYFKPKIFNIKTVTLENHADVLLESGFNELTLDCLLLYLTYVTRHKIINLIRKRLIPNDVNVQTILLNSLHSWPTSPAMAKIDYRDMSLYKLRMKILARYLELHIDLPQEEFQRKLFTYPRIKHKPFKKISQLLNIFHNKLGLNNKIIRSHFAILQSDPENVMNMFDNISYLSGISLKNFVTRYPGILLRNWKSIIRIQNIMDENNISYEAQRKCPMVYLLDHNTVENRLRDVVSKPEFSSFMHHPKMTSLILYKVKAEERLKKLKKLNKKCMSLNVLIGCNEHYQTFAQNQGDYNRGRDAKAIIKSLLDNQYSYEDIQMMFKETGCLNIVPVDNFKTVHDHLKDLFKSNEIFDNCHILLFPLENIKKFLDPLMILRLECKTNGDMNDTKTMKTLSKCNIDVSKLSMSSILSLCLYFMEKEYNFNGGGVWDDKK